jgi:hypothetical protein
MLQSDSIQGEALCPDLVDVCLLDWLDTCPSAHELISNSCLQQSMLPLAFAHRLQMAASTGLCSNMSPFEAIRGVQLRQLPLDDSAIIGGSW